MKSKDFIDRVKKAATDHKTLYVMGCFGAPLVGSSVNRYCTNHTYNQQAERTAMIRAAGNQSPPVFGFDCVNLIKGILWGWTGEPDKTYGGAKYAANGVPDTNADGMIQKCKDVTTDFSGLIPGEALWMSGHIGVYIGDGLAVESTPRWANGAQITAVHNIGTKSGYNGRKWTKHGRLPYVDYTDQTGASEVHEAVVAPQAGTYTAGGSNEETIFNFLRQVLGLNVAGACGVVANIRRESNFSTTALGDGGTSYGICQWHAGRFSNLKTWCAQNGKDYTTLDGQLWYLKAELEKSYAAVLSYIRAVPNTATGAYNAGYRWCLKFEIPANTVASSEQRGELARGTYWPKYAGAPASGVETPTTPVAPAYTGKFKVGDVVQFTGDDHYVSAVSLNAKMCRGGRATVTQVYPNGVHPYHLIRVAGGGATVYGWVDEDDIAAIAAEQQPATPETPTAPAAQSWTPAVGDVVFFTGSEHYTNALSTAPKPCRGGLAKITQIYKPESARHPYHLIRISGEGATVYGWVDAGSFSKA